MGVAAGGGGAEYVVVDKVRGWRYAVRGGRL